MGSLQGKLYCGSNACACFAFLVLQKGTGFKKASPAFQAHVQQQVQVGATSSRTGPSQACRKEAKCPRASPHCCHPHPGLELCVLPCNVPEDPAVPKGSCSGGCSARKTTPNLARTSRCSREQPGGLAALPKARLGARQAGDPEPRLGSQAAAVPPA